MDRERRQFAVRFPALVAGFGLSAAARGLSLAAVGALLSAPAQAGTAEPVRASTKSSADVKDGMIAVELNRTQSVSVGCRLSFVIQNRTTHVFESMQWDLVLFDPDGLIVTRTAAEAAPLPAGKTSVKLFDVPELGCDSLGKVLLNDVTRCETRADDDARVDCIELTAPSSRADVEFFK